MKELPKALSAEERHLVAMACPGLLGPRALALIDALTEALSEAVARMTVAEQKAREASLVRDLLAELNRWRSGSQADHMSRSFAQCDYVDGGPMGSDERCQLSAGHRGRHTC